MCLSQRKIWEWGIGGEIEPGTWDFFPTTVILFPPVTGLGHINITTAEI